MAGEAQLRVDGLRRLRRDLRAMGDDLADLKDVNAQVATFVATRSVPRAPRGKTGRLAGSVRGNRAVGRATVMAGGAAVPYAGPIHWGWPKRNIDPQPFIAETAQDTEATWLDLYTGGIDRVVDTKVAGNTY